MLESQRREDEVLEVDSLGKRLERLVFPSRKSASEDADSPAMAYPFEAADESLRDGSHTSSRSWHDTREWICAGMLRCCADLGSELFVKTWRERPRDACGVYLVLLHNATAFFLVLLSGIITYESSVKELRIRTDSTVIFPLYLPHSVSLALASVWTTAVAPGNLAGLYLSRMYMVWRGHLGQVSLNASIMLVVAIFAVLQSHIGAYFLRRCLCGVGTKKIPTIDSVADAVWYLVIVSFISLIFGTVISLVVTLTPLVPWANFWRYWSTWWLGILSTMITVTPLLTHLLAWEYRPSVRKPSKLFECILVAMTTAGLMVVVFFLNFSKFLPLPYLCFPLITWTSFRFNRVGWAFTVSCIAYCSALGSIRRRGALYNMRNTTVSSPSLILQVELFSCVMGIVGITLAAAVREKKQLTRKLQQWNLDLENTIDMRTMELRKANEELQISQKKAEQASHAKSDFLANMSHEIRTPIHGILGLTALLVESELSPDQKESLVSVKECADLLLHIINSVLDLAKIEAGRLEVEKVPFNIRKMVSSTFRMLQARAQERGLQLLWEVEKVVPQTLVGDVGKLQQCLLNLVGNALKFTHKGSVTVRVTLPVEHFRNEVISVVDTEDEPRNKVGETSSGKSSEKFVPSQCPDSVLVEFEVRDTGIGINKEKLQDMFKPFTQADASTSRLYGGTGLGLCIVQRFVELLGGTIWAESEVGKGSVFHLRLPFFLNSPKESPAELSPRVSDKNHGRQSWSLMGGLIFNPPGKSQSESTQPASVVQSRNSNLAARVQSANDLLGVWKDGKGIAIDDFDGNESFQNGYSTLELNSKTRADLVRRGGLALKRDPLSAPDRLQGGCLGGAQGQYSLEKTLSDPANSRTQYSQTDVPIKRGSKESDRSASNEVTQFVPQGSQVVANHSHANKDLWELLQPPNFMSASSQASSFPAWGLESAFSKPQGGPMDSISPGGVETSAGFLERERGNVAGLAISPQVAVTSAEAQSPHKDSASLKSDLSRESSAELDKMLDNKVSLKILLAEDNAINQKVASRQLEKHGHVVTIVGDGQQALDVICDRHNDFDLVLMDVQMPVMDGLCATDLIRKAEIEHGWARVPILGLTAHAIQGYQDTCLKHGMDGYLGKPFDIHQLLKKIGHLIPPERLGQAPVG